jgi:phosphoribosylcarboxyaminoimidazole (NCAIR) mutase
MAIDKPGAINAAIYAAEILSVSDPAIARRLVEYKEELARSVEEKGARVRAQFGKKSS